jgi:hypothetical protein
MQKLTAQQHVYICTRVVFLLFMLNAFVVLYRCKIVLFCLSMSKCLSYSRIVDLFCINFCGDFLRAIVKRIISTNFASTKLPAT